MAETIIKTRILNRIDTWENWSKSTVILKKGEIAICTIPQETESPELKPVPATGIKIGDNEHTFSQLPWLTALPSGIAEWAKAETKPTYQASEIEGLDAYVLGVENFDEELKKLANSDAAVEHQFVTAAVQENGIVTVTRAQPTTEDIQGLTEALLGKQDTLAFEGEYNSESNKVVTQSALTDAVAGLTGAMHFKGLQSSVPEDHSGYESGDVILVGEKEYVYDGTDFKELGDGSSFAIKGSIMNADIAADAAIEQSKIAGLTDALESKANAADLGELAAKDQVSYEDLDDTVKSKINGGLDPAALADIAYTGEVSALKQTDGTILVFDCGDSTDGTSDPIAALPIGADAFEEITTATDFGEERGGTGDKFFDAPPKIEWHANYGIATGSLKENTIGTGTFHWFPLQLGEEFATQPVTVGINNPKTLTDRNWQIKVTKETTKPITIKAGDRLIAQIDVRNMVLL